MFDNRLKILRLERGLSQKEVADILGIPVTTLSGYENNKREPNSETLINIANYFNCSIDYLVGRSEVKVDDDVLDKVNELDDDLLAFHGNIYEARKAQIERDRKLTSSQIISGERPFDLLSSDEIIHIKKYRAIDERGKRMVDVILKNEYERCYPTVKTISRPYYIGFAFVNQPDLLEDEPTDEIVIEDTPEHRRGDFIITVKDESMEPEYHYGDKVLVHRQSSVNVGEIGLFTLNRKMYIREFGEFKLIPHNSKSTPILFGYADDLVCYGKVLCKI